MAAALFLRHLSCLCAERAREDRAPLAEGQCEDTEKQAMIWGVLWASVKNYKNEDPGQKSRMSSQLLAPFSPQEVGCSLEPYKGESYEVEWKDS